MLHTTGNRRTFQHNLRLAALLCLTAGLVNVAGFIGFSVLTTNVTGHAALFAEALRKAVSGCGKGGDMDGDVFGRCFFCSLYIGKVGRENKNAYTLPVIVEIVILSAVAVYGHTRHEPHTTKYFASGLLFAMGSQNAMVSMISGSVVRTTHLTGMFTDLGIELAALFYIDKDAKREYHQKILLHFVIIICFIIGGVVGGYLYSKLDYYTLFVPAGLLVIVLFFDAFRERFMERLT